MNTSQVSDLLGALHRQFPAEQLGLDKLREVLQDEGEDEALDGVVRVFVLFHRLHDPLQPLLAVEQALVVHDLRQLGHVGPVLEVDALLGLIRVGVEYSQSAAASSAGGRSGAG